MNSQANSNPRSNPARPVGKRGGWKKHINYTESGGRVRRDFEAGEAVNVSWLL